MKNKFSTLYVILFISGIIGSVYFSMMPQWISDKEGSLSEFSATRALEKVAAIAKKPHYITSENHKVIEDYLEHELQELGLETEIQEGTTLSDWGNLVKSKNIMARIKGTNSSKALLLLSHYDSAPHSYSLGASDDASGIATIIEGIRTFLHQKTPHKNDIILLFSDAEELGLNGAALFATQHRWAKEIGLVLNFEARGTAGPSFMLMEANNGNEALVKGFSKSNPDYPVSNSLMYSIYKMLPNDTDLTVFREQKKIQGFNFAFIDDHFNYHTAQDDLNHLSKKSIAHQGAYLMPLLNYFSNSNLNDLNASEDYVYFNTPFGFIWYPFTWNISLLLAAIAAFIFLIIIGIGKRILDPIEIGKGFKPFFSALVASGTVVFVGWQLLLLIYPQYKEILQGFTYNGHDYIGAVVFLSLASCFLFYPKLTTDFQNTNKTIAPLSLWILINGAITFYLPGAGFFIIPVYFGLLQLAYYVITQKTNTTLNLILSIPTCIILVPFITMFPIGLGLKILAGSAVLTVLVFGLLLPVIGTFSYKKAIALSLLGIAIGFLTHAHLNSGYQKGTAKPNSLVYIYNADTNKASWVTYDVNLDSWTTNYLGEKPKKATTINKNHLFSKYDSEFTFEANAPIKKLKKSSITLLKDSTVGKHRFLKIRITPNRKVNRYDLFVNKNVTIHHLKANGASPLGQKESAYQRKGRKIISYYVADNEPLEIAFYVTKNSSLDLEVMESSFDLLTNNAFTIVKRAPWMMPKPFVLNDAVVILQKIKTNQTALVPNTIKAPMQASPLDSIPNSKKVKSSTKMTPTDEKH